MASTSDRITIGFPRMHKEPGERRDFLPPLIGLLAGLGAEVYVESGIGSAMGYSDSDYTSISPQVHASDQDTAYQQDIVVALRAPEGNYERLRRGAILISMLHFPTRPARVQLLSDLGIDAISLDTIVDDDGHRLIENLRSVAWNGIGAAFQALERFWPAMTIKGRPPIRVTIMGAGTVGKHAVEFATKYGDDARNEAFMRSGLAGVEVATTGRNLTRDPEYLRGRLTMTDILVDATQRHDASVPLIPNAWIGLMPDARRDLRPGRGPVPAGQRPARRARHRGDPAGQPRPVGVRPGRPGLGQAAARGPDGSPPRRGVVLLVAGRAPRAVHARVRLAAGADPGDAPAHRRAGRAQARGQLPRARDLASQPAGVAAR